MSSVSQQLGCATFSRILGRRIIDFHRVVFLSSNLFPEGKEIESWMDLSNPGDQEDVDWRRRRIRSVYMCFGEVDVTFVDIGSSDSKIPLFSPPARLAGSVLNKNEQKDASSTCARTLSLSYALFRGVRLCTIREDTFELIMEFPDAKTESAATDESKTPSDSSSSSTTTTRCVPALGGRMRFQSIYRKDVVRALQVRVTTHRYMFRLRYDPVYLKHAPLSKKRMASDSSSSQPGEVKTSVHPGAQFFMNGRMRKPCKSILRMGKMGFTVFHRCGYLFHAPSILVDVHRRQQYRPVTTFLVGSSSIKLGRAGEEELRKKQHLRFIVMPPQEFHPYTSLSAARDARGHGVSNPSSNSPFVLGHDLYGHNALQPSMSSLVQEPGTKLELGPTTPFTNFQARRMGEAPSSRSDQPMFPDSGGRRLTLELLSRGRSWGTEVEFQLWVEAVARVLALNETREKLARDYFVKSSTRFIRTMNATDDLCPWFGYLVHIVMGNREMAVLGLRRMYLPPYCDTFQDMLLVHYSRIPDSESFVPKPDFLELIKHIGSTISPACGPVPFQDFVELNNTYSQVDSGTYVRHGGVDQLYRFVHPTYYDRNMIQARCNALMYTSDVMQFVQSSPHLNIKPLTLFLGIQCHVLAYRFVSSLEYLCWTNPLKNARKDGDMEDEAVGDDDLGNTRLENPLSSVFRMQRQLSPGLRTPSEIAEDFSQTEAPPLYDLQYGLSWSLAPGVVGQVGMPDPIRAPVPAVRWQGPSWVSAFVKGYGALISFRALTRRSREANDPETRAESYSETSVSIASENVVGDVFDELALQPKSALLPLKSGGKTVEVPDVNPLGYARYSAGVSMLHGAYARAAAGALVTADVKQDHTANGYTDPAVLYSMNEEWQTRVSRYLFFCVNSGSIPDRVSLAGLIRAVSRGPQNQYVMEESDIQTVDRAIDFMLHLKRRRPFGREAEVMARAKASEYPALSAHPLPDWLEDFPTPALSFGKQLYGYFNQSASGKVSVGSKQSEYGYRKSQPSNPYLFVSVPHVLYKLQNPYFLASFTCNEDCMIVLLESNYLFQLELRCRQRVSVLPYVCAQLLYKDYNVRLIKVICETIIKNEISSPILVPPLCRLLKRSALYVKVFVLETLSVLARRSRSAVLASDALGLALYYIYVSKSQDLLRASIGLLVTLLPDTQSMMGPDMAAKFINPDFAKQLCQLLSPRAPSPPAPSVECRYGYQLVSLCASLCFKLGGIRRFNRWLLQLGVDRQLIALMNPNNQRYPRVYLQLSACLATLYVNAGPYQLEVPSSRQHHAFAVTLMHVFKDYGQNAQLCLNVLVTLRQLIRFDLLGKPDTRSAKFIAYVARRLYMLEVLQLELQECLDDCQTRYDIESKRSTSTDELLDTSGKGMGNRQVVSLLRALVQKGKWFTSRIAKCSRMNWNFWNRHFDKARIPSMSQLELAQLVDVDAIQKFFDQ